MISLVLAVAGDPARVALDKSRSAIAEARTAIEDVTSAPLSLAEATERVLHDLRERAEWPQNSLATYALPGAPIVFDADQRALNPLDALLTLPMLFNLVPDIVEKGIRAHLKIHCANAGLPRAERPSRLSELRTKLEALLEEEERITVELLARGIVVERAIPESGDDIERLLTVWNCAA